jgi:hypothetical protein
VLRRRLTRALGPTSNQASVNVNIAVYIDSCAWNYLFDNSVDLEVELPCDRFSIYVTREVEIELEAIPDVGSDGTDKSALKRYINQNIGQKPVTTIYVFGFQTLEPDGTPSPVQVYGGFDVGTWQSEQEQDFYSKPKITQQLQSTKRTKSGLGKNQADASLGAKSLSSIVLTNERIDKAGPLKVAADLGGRVVYLSAQVKPSGLTIGDYLLSLGATNLPQPTP